MRIGLNNRLAEVSARKAVCQVTLPKVDAINRDDWVKVRTNIVFLPPEELSTYLTSQEAVGTATATSLFPMQPTEDSLNILGVSVCNTRIENE